MKSSAVLFGVASGVALASSAPSIAQDPHQQETPPATAQAAPSTTCPMGGPGMGSRAMNGSAMGQGMMMGGQQMMQMMQTMQQMHAEMQQMHQEMMQMRKDMRDRR